MVRIYSDIDDFFSKYGIEHFLKKYQFVDSDENQVCIINYGALNSGPFVIKITPNEISDAIQGYVTAFGKTLPVFEKPLETDDSGIIVACFENGSEKYPCVSFSDNEVTIGCDIFKNTGYLLSPNFDELVLNYDQKTKEQFRHYPLVDFYQDILFKSILYGYSKLNAPLVKKSPWPDGRKFAVALTHDVDELKKTYQWITRPVQYAYNRKFKLLINQFKSLLHKCMGEDPYWTFEKIIEIENNLDV
ncbi:MAG: hypothetical protein QCI00_05105, partial [Candidatus Thermoplasmatota archaeon]|nr:hypothetical protein [Candidatus Thermoplasmatota archaeon]